MDVLAATAAEGELDALTLRHNAQVEAWGYRNQAQNYDSQSVLLRAGKGNPATVRQATLLSGRASQLGQLGGLIGTGRTIAGSLSTLNAQRKLAY